MSSCACLEPPAHHSNTVIGLATAYFPKSVEGTSTIGSTRESSEKSIRVSSLDSIDSEKYRPLWPPLNFEWSGEHCSHSCKDSSAPASVSIPPEEFKSSEKVGSSEEFKRSEKVGIADWANFKFDKALWTCKGSSSPDESSHECVSPTSPRKAGSDAFAQRYESFLKGHCQQTLAGARLQSKATFPLPPKEVQLGKNDNRATKVRETRDEQSGIDPNLQDLMLASTLDAYQVITAFECSFLPSIIDYKKDRKNAFWDSNPRPVRAVIFLVDLLDSMMIEETKKVLMESSNEHSPLPIVVNFPQTGKRCHRSDNDAKQKIIETSETLIAAGAGDVIIKCDQDTPMAIEIALTRTRLLSQQIETIIMREQERSQQKETAHLRGSTNWTKQASQYGLVIPEVDPNLRAEVTAQGATAISGLELIDIIGSGSTAKVYKARSMVNNQVCVLKAIQKTPDKNANAAMREIKCLQKLPAHPHIPKLHKVLHSCDILYLCLDYGGLDTLHNVQKRCPERKLDVRIVQQIFSQVADAIFHMHRHNFCHRDIKPENVVMNGMKACLVDYGLATEAGKLLDRCCGTLPFAAPEILESPPRYHGEQVDAFALGVLGFEMAWGLGSFFLTIDWHGEKREPSVQLSKHLHATLTDGVPGFKGIATRQWRAALEDEGQDRLDLHEVIQGLVQPHTTKRWDLAKVCQSRFLTDTIAYEQALPNIGEELW